jgi:hypothetical protein
MRKGRAMPATLSYSYHNDKKIDLTLLPPFFIHNSESLWANNMGSVPPIFPYHMQE